MIDHYEICDGDSALNGYPYMVIVYFSKGNENFWKHYCSSLEDAHKFINELFDLEFEQMLS